LENPNHTTPGRDINSVLTQRTPVIENRMMSVRGQDQIVPLPAPREIYLGVIDDMVCANRSRRVHIPRAAHSSDFSPERFGNLHRKCTHTTRRAFNKNLVAWLDPSLVTKTLQRRACRDWYRGRVLKR